MPSIAGGVGKQIVSGSMGSLVVKLANVGATLILSVVLTRYLGTVEFGVYSTIIACVTIAAIPAQLGIPTLVIRETAKAQLNEDWSLTSGLWHWATRAILVTSAIIIVLAATLLAILYSFLTASNLLAGFLSLSLVPLIALGNLRGAALRGLRHVVFGQLPEFVLRPLFLILLVAAVGLSANFPSNAFYAVIFHNIASLLAFFAGALMLRKFTPLGVKGAPNRTLSATWLKDAVPLAFVQGLLLVNQQIGIVASGVLSSSEQAGYFRIASLGAAFVTFGVLFLGPMAAPHLARFHSQGDRARISRMLKYTSWVSLAIGVPTLVVFYLFGREILVGLFGAQFEGAYPALLILGWGQLANAATGTVVGMLNMSGNDKSVAGAMAFGALANVATTIVLTPIYGAVGAAIASTISLVILTLPPSFIQRDVDSGGCFGPAEPGGGRGLAWSWPLSAAPGPVVG